MKPIVIIQHEHDVGPGHFARYLTEHDLPHQTVRVFAGDSIPASSEPFAGICSLGGGMSVNDDLHWIDAELSLMRDADRRGVSIIGHCLGGQLLAKAFDAQIFRSAVKEIGWSEVEVDDFELAGKWVGEQRTFQVFQWHGDMFSLPFAAQRFLTSRLCENQAFVIERGEFAHLGMQFHVEMTPQLVLDWAIDPNGIKEVDEAFERQGGAGVQRSDEMVRDLDQRAQQMSVVADRLYDQWARGLRRSLGSD
ncbi:MAG: type 1 glutamine amidotransferase [Burkholderiaceae bacterium]